MGFIVDGELWKIQRNACCDLTCTIAHGQVGTPEVVARSRLFVVSACGERRKPKRRIREDRDSATLVECASTWLAISRARIRARCRRWPEPAPPPARASTYLTRERRLAPGATIAAAIVRDVDSSASRVVGGGRPVSPSGTPPVPRRGRCGPGWRLCERVGPAARNVPRARAHDARTRLRALAPGNPPPMWTRSSCSRVNPPPRSTRRGRDPLGGEAPGWRGATASRARARPPGRLPPRDTPPPREPQRARGPEAGAARPWRSPSRRARIRRHSR
jgi:hypothetical protein